MQRRAAHGAPVRRVPPSPWLLVLFESSLSATGRGERTCGQACFGPLPPLSLASQMSRKKLIFGLRTCVQCQVLAIARQSGRLPGERARSRWEGQSRLVSFIDVL